MKLISHRGNIHGINQERENTKSYISEAIYLGFDVEIDLRYINESLFLGHDIPIEIISLNWLEKYRENLWIHCKDIHSLLFLKDQFNVFYHTSEDYVLTSDGFIWTYSGVKLYKNVIAVLPENQNYSNEELSECYGICSDFIINYENEKNN